jgi:septal ring factor EnvC (AmiA/AmiB activator)
MRVRDELDTKEDMLQAATTTPDRIRAAIAEAQNKRDQAERTISTMTKTSIVYR